MVILVTGANGQLGQSLLSVAENYPGAEFVFCTSASLDITDEVLVRNAFREYKPDYCINAAAYTAVDKAESETEKAYLVNATGAKNLTLACAVFDTVLLHISTDFVFDGTSVKPYSERDTTNPQGVYGHTKLAGESVIRETWKKHFIIRTSWVYSRFGHNFMKTMLRLAKENGRVSVVNDQIGTPTNAIDLSEALLDIIYFTDRKIKAGENPEDLFGTYNFSNEGQCSWFDFAEKIFEITRTPVTLTPVPSSDYPTPAKRPAYSVLDKHKIKETFGIQISDWKTSLTKELQGQ